MNKISLGWAPWCEGPWQGNKSYYMYVDERGINYMRYKCLFVSQLTEFLELRIWYELVIATVKAFSRTFFDSVFVSWIKSNFYLERSPYIITTQGLDILRSLKPHWISRPWVKNRSRQPTRNNSNSGAVLSIKG